MPAAFHADSAFACPTSSLPRHARRAALDAPVELRHTLVLALTTDMRVTLTFQSASLDSAPLARAVSVSRTGGADAATH